MGLSLNCLKHIHKTVATGDVSSPSESKFKATRREKEEVESISSMTQALSCKNWSTCYQRHYHKGISRCRVVFFCVLIFYFFLHLEKNCYVIIQ